MKVNRIALSALSYLVAAIAANDILTPTVQQPSAEYVKLLNHSILFFEAQRAGRLPSNNRIPW